MGPVVVHLYGVGTVRPLNHGGDLKPAWKEYVDRTGYKFTFTGGNKLTRGDPMVIMICYFNWVLYADGVSLLHIVRRRSSLYDIC